MDIFAYQKLESLDEFTAKMDEKLSSKVDTKTRTPEKTVQIAGQRKRYIKRRGGTRKKNFLKV